MSIIDFIDFKINSLGFIPLESLNIMRCYLDGLIRGNKKSVSGIVREIYPIYSIKSFLRHLKKLKGHQKSLKHHAFQQIIPKLDRCSKIIISGDDTTHQVYGKMIYGASIQHDHALNASINSIKLVDLVVSDLKERVLFNDFNIYLPKKFIEKYKLKGFQFLTKIQLLQELILYVVENLKFTNMPKKSIWVVTDSWYVSGEFDKSLHDLGVNSVLQLKKDRKIRLFDKWFRIDEYFEKHKKWHYFTYGKEKKKVYYKEAMLGVSKIGRRKIFMFKEENEKKCRYYMASDCKITAKTTYRYIKRRWSVETMHRELKQFFGFKETYSGRKSYLLAHYITTYFGWLLFQWFKWQNSKNKEKITTEKLWQQYISEMKNRNPYKQCPYRNKGQNMIHTKQKMKKFNKRKIPLEIMVCQK